MPLEDVLVAILPKEAASSNSRTAPVGAGLLVAPNLVLTCAHVVNAASKRPPEATGRPTGEVAVRLHSPPSIVLASVDPGADAWSDPPAGRQKGADLCLLLLTNAFNAPLPLLADSDNFIGKKFRTAGYPRTWDIDPAKGDIEASDSAGLYLLRPDQAVAAIYATQIKSGLISSEERPAGLIHSGFSGAPVEVDGRIAGLVAEAKAQPSQATAYMIPVSAFPRRLAGLIDDVFRTYREALNDKPKAVRIRLERTVLRAGQEKPGESAAAGAATLETALLETPRIVLLGDPGIGKSTALRGLERADLPWIPIRLDLRFYIGAEELEVPLAKRINDVLKGRRTSLTENQSDAVSFLKGQLLKGNRDFLFLLDGLDEVKPEHHERIRDAIKSLLSYPHRCVISCRATDYDGFFAAAVPWLLQGLSPVQIRDYLGESLGAPGLAIFDDQIVSDHQLLNLAANPLLLELIATIGRSKARIPSRRAELLQSFVETMPAVRRKEGGGTPVPQDIVNTALEALGYGMVDRGIYAANLADLRSWAIPAATFTLDAILIAAHDSRLLLSDGYQDDPVQFIHPLFRDYFAARFFKKRIESTLSAAERAELEKRIWWPTWNQTILMVASIHRNPAQFITEMAGRLRIDAGIGSLFVSRYGPMTLLRMAFGGVVRCSFLFRCWQTSPAASDPASTAAVVGALRAVVRYAKPALLAGNDVAVSECVAAVDGLAKIGDRSAIEDLEGLLALSRGPYRAPISISFGLSTNLLISRATKAVKRLRGETIEEYSIANWWQWIDSGA